MKVREVTAILAKCDPEMDMAIEQIFRENKSIILRSVEIINNCVIFKDHTVRTSQRSVFVAVDGAVFDVPHEWEALVK
jgi:hypothetical protein